MIPLPTTVRSDGFTLEQVVRDGDVAVYSKTKPGHLKTTFEVIRVGSHKGFEIGGKQIPPAETYPSSNQWGVNGWTCPTKEAAFKKMDEWMGHKAQ